MLDSHFTQKHHTKTRPTLKAVKLAAKTQNDQAKLATVKSQRQRKQDHSDDSAFCETKLSVWNIQQK
ncbi:hypothetical protein D908_16884 [Vibrio mimicus CAIM 602]|nr:hypothetical protein D908_16884 [Vibrio mimicus CAIM 602]